MMIDDDAALSCVVLLRSYYTPHALSGEPCFADSPKPMFYVPATLTASVREAMRFSA